MGPILQAVCAHTYWPRSLPIRSNLQGQAYVCLTLCPLLTAGEIQPWVESSHQPYSSLKAPILQMPRIWPSHASVTSGWVRLSQFEVSGAATWRAGSQGHSGLVCCKRSPLNLVVWGPAGMGTMSGFQPHAPPIGRSLDPEVPRPD